jgi:predicted RNA binding protein YcfA (HicA-like mRNA interferase family)
MPRKLRQLIADLQQSGFVHVSTTGSHRKFKHRSGAIIILSGQSGADAHPYQEQDVKAAIAATQKT